MEGACGTEADMQLPWSGGGPRGPTALARIAALRLVGPLFAIKLIVLAAVPLSWALLPPMFDHASYIRVYQDNFGTRPAGPPPLSYAFRTWDADHYLDIAVSGYRDHLVNHAFYPLWPYLVRAGSWVLGGNELVAGVVLANLFSLIAMVLLYYEVFRREGPRVAHGMLVLFLAFPGAFFFCFPYSESLFLLLVVGAVLAHDRQWPLPAALLALAAPLARAVGIALVLPLALQSLKRRGGYRDVLIPLAPCFGLAAYLGIMAYETGNPFAGFDAQRKFIAAASITALFEPVAFVRSLWDIRAVHGFLGSAVDRLLFAWVLLGCVLLAIRVVRKRCVWSAVLLSLGLSLAVLSAVPIRLMAFTRYGAVIFPAHLAIARALQKPAARPWLWVLAVGFALLQVVLLLRHVNHMWAG